MPDNSRTNSLINETSPYLLQHAHNPVEWHPWNEAALRKAREENKPILLSIGYSACHWCHVMAHESFEDQGAADVMNELFINIKVDREERPDLDKIYQTAHQLLTQRGGGWPLTMFLTPDDQTPFFGGTYFPNEPRHGMPAFRDIMRRVETFYREHADDIAKQNATLNNIFNQLNPVASEDEISAAPLDSARQQLERSFDHQHGGFGEAPRFPHPTNLERLLRHWAATRKHEHADERALNMVKMSLHAMASGGIYDQIGGGFCRYSVDDQWMIPHFEKMLYDNAQLLSLYADAYTATGDKAFGRIVSETADWVIREMQSPEGGYYSALDADSEGKEGLFYAWEPEEVEKLLTKQEYAVTSRHYGFDHEPNFEGKWHAHIFQSVEEIAEALDISLDEVLKNLSSARKKLFTAREKRVRPGRDDKILTSWNGLMIKGMAAAGRCLENDEYTRSAERALEFIETELWQDCRLLATCKDGKAHLMAYLDDYAFAIASVLELLQTRWKSDDLCFALLLAEVLLEHFEDPDNHGFYFTADDHEQLIHRPKPFADDAIPSGNGVATWALLRLGHIMGESRYVEAAEHTLKAAWSAIADMPYAHNTLLHAVEEYLYPVQMVIIRGTEKDMEPWVKKLRQDYAPRRMVLAIDKDATGLPESLEARKPAEDVIAYVCTGPVCSAPFTKFDDLENALKQTETH